MSLYICCLHGGEGEFRLRYGLPPRSSHQVKKIISCLASQRQPQNLAGRNGVVVTTFLGESPARMIYRPHPLETGKNLERMIAPLAPMQE